MKSNSTHVCYWYQHRCEWTDWQISLRSRSIQIVDVVCVHNDYIVQLVVSNQWKAFFRIFDWWICTWTEWRSQAIIIWCCLHYLMEILNTNSLQNFTHLSITSSSSILLGVDGAFIGGWTMRSQQWHNIRLYTCDVWNWNTIQWHLIIIKCRILPQTIRQHFVSWAHKKSDPNVPYAGHIRRFNSIGSRHVDWSGF